MHKTTGFKFVFWVASWLCYAGIATGAEKPRSQQILECMVGNVPESVVADRFKLVHVNRLNEASEYILQAHAQRSKKSVETSAQVKSPASMAGGAYLLRANQENYQIYMYLPSIGQVRRLTGDSLGQSSLLGTDLSWEDMQLMYYALLEGTLSLRGESTYRGRKVDQVLLIPSPKSQTAYSRIYLDVDQQTCLPLEVRLEASNGELHKKITVAIDSLEQVDGRYWYARNVRLDDLREGTHTRLEVTRSLVADEKLRSQLFNPKQFHVSR